MSHFHTPESPFITEMEWHDIARIPSGQLCYHTNSHASCIRPPLMWPLKPCHHVWHFIVLPTQNIIKWVLVPKTDTLFQYMLVRWCFLKRDEYVEQGKHCHKIAQTETNLVMLCELLLISFHPMLLATVMVSLITQRASILNFKDTYTYLNSFLSKKMANLPMWAPNQALGVLMYSLTISIIQFWTYYWLNCL